MTNIYHDVYEKRGSYDELRDFGETDFYENRHGMYAIVYQRQDTRKDKWQPPYQFGISITGLEDPLFEDQESNFDIEFPLLGVKLTGYHSRFLRKSQFDPKTVAEKYARELDDYQQAYLPLQLSIEPTKKSYRVREDIEFDVVLRNVSKKHVFVKTLGPNTLYFLLNNSRWGTRPSEFDEGGQRAILRTGEEMRVRFKGEGYLHAQEVSIYGVYNLGIQGVKPHARIQIMIVE